MSRGDFKHNHEFTALSQRLETPGVQPAPASERAIAGREAAKPSRHRGTGAGGRAHRRHGAPAASALRHPPARRGGGRASGPKAASEGSPGAGVAAPRRTERPLGPDTGPDGFALPEATGPGRHLGPSSGQWGATTGGALAFAALRSAPPRPVAVAGRCRRSPARSYLRTHRPPLAFRGAGPGDTTAAVWAGRGGAPTAAPKGQRSRSAGGCSSRGGSHASHPPAILAPCRQRADGVSGGAVVWWWMLWFS